MKTGKLHSFWLLMVATIITVAIVTASQIITQRIGLLLDRHASELLAGDLLVEAGSPLDDRYREEALSRGLQVSQAVSFRSAIFIDDLPQLVAIKAVDESYPLRGNLERSLDLASAKEIAPSGPQAGEAWVDSKLVNLLQQDLTLGSRTLPVNWMLTYEPDRGGTIFNLAPRVMMNLADLESTGLIVPGSRARHRMMFAGELEQIEDFRLWLEDNLASGETIQDLKNARPEMRQALDRTGQFFSLSIVLTLVIAMVAIAITARYSANLETSKIAMLRAFGISRPILMKYYAKQLGAVWLYATIGGFVVGWASQFPLEWGLDGWFDRELPPSYSLMPYLMGAITGLIALTGFSVPYLLNAISTPPMQVLRAIASRSTWQRRMAGLFTAIVSIFLVLALLMQDSRIAVITLLIILGCAIVLPLLLGLLIRLVLTGGGARFWARQYLLSRLLSSSRGAVYVMSGFSLVLIAILLIGVVKDELLYAWNDQLPESIPNYFLVNIPTADVPEIESFLNESGIPASDAYALVRARLAAINGTAIDQITFEDPRADGLVNHTFNISYADELPSENQIVSGQWISAGGSQPELSVEEGMAQRLNLELGDLMSLKVGSEVLQAPITSIRSVVWENFKPNFYLIANRELLQQMPQTWLLSASVNDDSLPQLRTLVRQYPSVTLLDITELMERIRGVVSKATVALQFFFVFAIVSAFVVLLAAIQTGKQEREIETSLLRALGAETRQLFRMHVFEFSLMGVLIGFFAASIASLAGWFVSERFFEIDYHLSLSVWGYGMLSSVILLTIAGTLVSSKVYNISPMKVLRS